MPLHVIIQTLLNSLMFASILSLSTFGVILIYKTSNTTNFAQGIISAFGAYVTTYLFHQLNVMQGWNLPAIVFLPGGILVAFLLGLLIDTQIFRRGRRVLPIGKQMITMGLVLIFTGLIPVIFGKLTMNMGYIAEGVITFDLGGNELRLSWHNLLMTIISLVILGTLFLALKYTKWGLGVRATASNEVIAQMMGINTRVITALSWAIAGGLGALAASMYVPAIQIDPYFMTNMQVNAFLSSILGGFSTFYGPIVGAILITVSGNLIGYNFSLAKDVIVYTLILIVILIKPLGLFGKKVIKKV